MNRVRLWWAAPTAGALVGGIAIGVVFASDLAGGASVPDRIAVPSVPASASRPAAPTTAHPTPAPPATQAPRVVVVPTVVAPSRQVETEGPDDHGPSGGGDGSGDH